MEFIQKYFTGFNNDQLELFARLEPVYSNWNEKINVISRKDIAEIYERHVLHSLAIAKVISFNPGTKILDVGTGGGFPGIPLAIAFPGSEFHLVDSIGKKIKVVNEVVRELGLKNVKAEQLRAEQLKTKYDFIVSRAVTAFPTFVSWVRNKVSADQKNSLLNGILYLKGGDFPDEIKPFGKRIHIYELNDFFEEEFFETKKLIHLSF
ncbi:MAG: 16S rRNA (guanine(527)-N(7))-methyltransferase RsmG [Prolixibacteraceae bacterium]|nr:16S rRNA (guanine(527)-N(7))-methyltransferase RsmG [Prolixibacteraceae bacterium]MBN2773938.1 16S rRNA (guanine(527)-N(7))-methyltransferase RsmG [Prolixibacteraceae bacterium]